jgi:uncharacterized protein YuzE
MDVMREPYLEVTFRHGRALAAYYYLPRESGVRSHRTERAADGILIDYSEADKPIGIELTAPAAVTVRALNQVLDQLGQPAIREEDLAPLTAA